MSSTFFHQGQGKFPALGLSKVRWEGSEPAPGAMARAGKLALRVWLHLCACTAVSIYNSLGTAASITPVCCDPAGNALTEQPVTGGRGSLQRTVTSQQGFSVEILEFATGIMTECEL